MVELDERFILNEEALDELYAWIDTIPLSRPKKNIARDFSDGVLVAETVAHFLPKMVDIHNYFSASAAGQKKINWNTLNRRVFSKMGIRIKDSTIQDLIESKSGAIEQVLWDLRRKIQEPQPVMASTRSIHTRSKSPSSGYAKSSPSTTNPAYFSTGASQKLQQSTIAIVTPLPFVEPAATYELENTSSTTAQIGNTPTRTGSTITSYSSQVSSPQSHGYVVQPSAVTYSGEESSNNNAAQVVGGPPAQIIYRGHKMIPLSLLDDKDREIKALEFTNKNLTVKVHRLDTLINVKDQRIEDLTHQLHSLRAIYERVTQQTWQGFQS